MTTPAALAPGLSDWPALAAAMSGCTACALAESRQRVVPGVMPADARVLLVGEAPGRSEDEGGLPFIGRSGRLLDDLLGEVGLDRSELAVCNTVKCRPPDNRTPKRAELDTCRPWLDRQVEVIGPDVVVTLGGTALAWALGRGVRIGEVHGTVHERAGHVVVPTYHPSAALRFGPSGAPALALRADLRVVADLLT
jgi:uracil-DNA glycosylase family 4